MKAPADLRDLVIYAWVGEDELGSGVVGLKQAQTPAGMIPLAAMGHHLDRMLKLAPAMQALALLYGKKIRLCRFAFEDVIRETESGD